MTCIRQLKVQNRVDKECNNVFVCHILRLLLLIIITIILGATLKLKHVYIILKIYLLCFKITLDLHVARDLDSMALGLFS